MPNRVDQDLVEALRLDLFLTSSSCEPALSLSKLNKTGIDRFIGVLSICLVVIPVIGGKWSSRILTRFPFRLYD